MAEDQTKQFLEQLLAELYRKQATQKATSAGSYLQAQDGQYLGTITNNIYDRSSILNEYGPYGSGYSPTSIFNPYSKYGSEYGQHSINNTYCSKPPKLFIKGIFKGFVSVNNYVRPKIPTEAFLYTLRNNISALMEGRIIKSELEARLLNGESFIEAANGQYLGSLNPNQLDLNSIFNQFSPYGSKFSQNSLFNQFSPYGNQFSDLSPYNLFSNNSPKIYVNGKFVAYLTVNQMIQPRVHPNDLLNWAKNNVPYHLV